MRIILTGLLILIIVSCNQEDQLNGRQILNESIMEHDSLGNWNNAVLKIHIQEPRISNPYRYSILKLDNSTNTFELSRNRDQYISKHIVESDGSSLVLLNGIKEIEPALIKKYRLDASRNIGYKNFYQIMYGLPMSLSKNINEIIETTEDVFSKEECYKIEVLLKEKIISKYWYIYIAKSNKRLIGIEIIFPDKPDEGERLYFEGNINIGGLNIPRIRHWHKLKNDVYSGSDIIIKELIN